MVWDTFANLLKRLLLVLASGIIIDNVKTQAAILTFKLFFTLWPRSY
jgi:hypothetical protein